VVLSPQIPRWTLESNGTPRGVVVAFHGLNQRPCALDQLCGELGRAGFYVYRPVLSGHDGSGNDEVTEAAWIDDVRKSLVRVHEQYPELPLHVVGYSIGGLLAVRSLDLYPDMPKPSSMILLAPALSLRTFTHLSRAFAWAASLSLRVPSLTPKDYRVYPSIPTLWYKNLFELVDSVQQVRHPDLLQSIPVLAILNPRDELVSPSGIEDWIARNQLKSSWRTLDIEPAPTDPLSYEHLLIDERGLGKKPWLELIDSVTGFLAAGPARQSR
jgi:pimeloyl-ACP methyl ester carboxylesterase